MPHPLLEGPRGRRLCTVALAHRDPEVWSTWHRAAWAPGDSARFDGFVAALHAAEPLREVALADLAATVDDAAYWQPPHDTEDVLLDPRVLAALEPTAGAVAAISADSWWNEPIGADQAIVRWEENREPLSATEAVANWKAHVVRDEWDRRPGGRLEGFGGAWWSTPTGGPATTRSAAGLPALALALVEDNLGWERPSVQRVDTRDARILEVDQPSAWTRLVDRYPLEVTWSRRHEWQLATRLETRWFLPDWSLVAADFDGVHLTANAYLLIAGNPIPVPGGHTLVAGWSPDWTYWITDRFERVGEPETWVPNNDRDEWRRAVD